MNYSFLEVLMGFILPALVFIGLVFYAGFITAKYF